MVLLPGRSGACSPCRARMVGLSTERVAWVACCASWVLGGAAEEAHHVHAPGPASEFRNKIKTRGTPSRDMGATRAALGHFQDLKDMCEF